MTTGAAPGARRIAIAGAGIGGLTAALALAEGGREVTVIEKRTGFPADGAGIQLSPNASRVLRDLGLGSALRRAASQPDRVAIRSLRTGRPIGAVALGPAMEERLGAPFLVVARADLHTLLLDAVRSRSNIRLRIGRAVTGWRAEADGIAVSTRSDGGATDEVTADLLVGADGIGSRVRGTLGDDRPPRFAKALAFRALVPVGASTGGPDANETGLWLGRGRHVVHYPIRGGGTLNVVAVAASGRPVESWSAPTTPEAVLSRFADAAPVLRALLEAAPAWSAWSLADLPCRSLGRGRVALLGDAAHPVLPFLAQGGALAIEDAAVLARVLRGGDAARAVWQYDRLRRGRVRRVQEHARRNGAVYHAGGPMAVVRDIGMARLGPERMATRYDWLYGWRAPAD